jgi:ribosomal-protein-alanine N-acetyltransferase
MQIEPATLADVDAIHRLEKEAFPAPWRREFFESELRSSGRLNVVARSDGEVIGYLFAMWLFDEMHVNKIAVAEKERRRGVARALMRECDAFAIRNGIRTISLEVRESNEPAQAFYRTLGFASLYVRPRYYPDGEAAVVMMREVS